MKKINNYQFIFTNNEKERIDKFLKKQLQNDLFSRANIQKFIADGNATVNEKKVTSNKYLLQQNDVVKITIYDSKDQESVLQPFEAPINIIYEDDDLLVIDKANNVVVHPGAGNKNQTLVNSLIHHSKLLSTINGDFRPGIVHRLDKQTTGLIIVAKNNQSHHFLANELKEHKINRIYTALVHGKINSKSGTIETPIARDPNNRLKMIVNEKNSKQAITHFKVVKTFSKFTLVDCELETGRTHQIRVHFQWIKHPIVNDPIYSRYAIEDKFLGQYLHARKITFIHPKTKKLMKFESTLPNFFQKKLQLLSEKNSEE